MAQILVSFCQKHLYLPGVFSGISYHFPDSPPPRTLLLTWEQTHHSQDGDSVLMHWPWEVRKAMTEWVQRLFWNRDKVQKP